ncbi:MAG TPA: energy transducer TonB [Rhodanobacteraceae bacterium]|nr:energy transducer TonB [Rhodanobacteraceae bacterium]
MMTFSRSEWEPFGLAGGLRGAALVVGAALLLGGCGQAPNTPSSVPAAQATKPRASAPPASSPPSSAPAVLPEAVPAAATSSAQAQQAASAAKLQAMSVQDLLAAARTAYAQHRLVAPAGDNAMEYYEAVLARDPNNQVATDALREAFPFGVPEVEKAITQNNYDEANREIALLSKADSTNYTLTLLRSKLDAQKKLQARQQQQSQLQEQKAAELAAAQKAAARATAEKEAAARLAAEQQAAAAAKAAAAPPKPVAPPPPRAVGESRAAVALAAAVPNYPIEAARNQTSGYAVVEFTVSTDGSVENPHVIDSAPRRVFDDAAIQAVRRSKFKPALKDGQPVVSTVRRRIDFKFGG